jgi:hypothetical protein
LLDSGASHNFISTRLAAELIALGAQYRKCELPIQQGCIRAGVSRLMIEADVLLMFQGVVKHLTSETVWVWDMGADILLCHATICEESLSLEPNPPEDDALINQFVTRTGDFQLGQGESLLLDHLRERSRNNLVAELTTIAQLPPPSGHRVHPERLARMAAVNTPIKEEPSDTRLQDRSGRNRCCSACLNATATSDDAQVVQDQQDESVLRDHLNGARGATHSRFDGMRFEEVLELRRTLLCQLRTPVEDLKKRLEEIKSLYPEAFSDTVEKPCTLRKFEIKLKDNFRYYCFLPRRVSDPVLQEMKAQITALLQQGVIQECHDSPWAFPIVMARRPGSDKLRLCVDFTSQNEQTVPLPFTIPEAKQQLDKLAGRKFFCSLDCSSFFHQFEIREEDRDYTAFVVPWGQKFRWTRVPFGLRNSPAHTQKEFQQLLAQNGMMDIIPYYDDVCFGSETADELCDKFEKLLRLAVTYGLKFKESKCKLGMEAICHLGFVCNQDGIYIHPDRVSRLLRIPPAKNIDELRHILGAFTYVRAWTKNAATIAAPLTDLLRKGVSWQWTERQEEALRLLKQSVALAPCLAGDIDPKKKVYVACDASILGVAAVLFQYHHDPSGKRDKDGNVLQVARPLMYASRRFSPTEFRWSINVKEAYSIKYCFEQWGNLLQGYAVTVQTDHKNSLWMWQSKDPKVERWRLFLQRWQTEIVHIPGQCNVVPDALSRMHVDNLEAVAPTDAAARICHDDVTSSDEAGMESTDADITSAMMNQIISLAIDDQQQPATLGSVSGGRSMHEAKISAALAKYSYPDDERQDDDDGHEGGEGESVSFCEFCELPQAVLSSISGEEVDVVQPEPPVPQQAEFIGPPLPEFRILEQLRSVHNSQVGHFGVLTTYRRLLLLQDCCWGLSPSEIRAEVMRYVKACPECQKAEGLPSPWQSTRFIRQRPFREISIDVLQMPYVDVSGARKVLTSLCSFTRAVEFFPLEFADAPRVAECLHWLRCRYGPFAVLRCDGAKAFIQSVVPIYLRLCGTSVHNVTPFAHWENGQVERCHRSALRHLKYLINDDAAGPNSQKSWVPLLATARRIMMNTVCSSTGETPNAFVFGGFADTEADMFLSNPVPAPSRSNDAHAFVRELQEEQLRVVARGEDYQGALLEKIAARAESNDVPLPAGSYVLAYRAGMPHGRPVSKLQFRWSGPWRVLERGGDDSHPRVQCLHLASKLVEEFSLHELKVFNLALLDGEDELAAVAERDDWDYSLDSILEHRPPGLRGRRAKSQYEFLVLYKYLERSTEPGQENPSWQPYSAVAHTEALQSYCSRPEIARQLGTQFFVANES